MDRSIRDAERRGDVPGLLRARMRAGLVETGLVWLRGYLGDTTYRAVVDYAWETRDAWWELVVELPRYCYRDTGIWVAAKLMYLVLQEEASNRALMEPGDWFHANNGNLNQTYDPAGMCHVFHLSVIMKLIMARYERKDLALSTMEEILTHRALSSQMPASLRLLTDIIFTPRWRPALEECLFECSNVLMEEDMFEAVAGELLERLPRVT